MPKIKTNKAERKALMDIQRQLQNLQQILSEYAIDIIVSRTGKEPVDKNCILSFDYSTITYDETNEEVKDESKPSEKAG